MQNRQTTVSMNYIQTTHETGSAFINRQTFGKRLKRTDSSARKAQTRYLNHVKLRSEPGGCSPHLRIVSHRQKNWSRDDTETRNTTARADYAREMPIRQVHDIEDETRRRRVEHLCCFSRGLLHLRIEWAGASAANRTNFYSQSFLISSFHSHLRCSFLSSSVNKLLMLYVPRAIMPVGASSTGVVYDCSSFFGP